MDIIDQTDSRMKVEGSRQEAVCLKKPDNFISGGIYKEIFDGIGAAAAIYRAENGGEDFIFVDFNKAAEQLDNISRNQVVGRNIIDVFPKTRSCGLIEVFSRVFKTGKPERFHVRLIKDGVLTGWRSNYVFKLDSGLIVSTYRSDTKRRQMDHQAEEHRKKLRELTSELALSEERQRRKIAAQLHDQLSQWLAISVMKLGFLRDSVNNDVAEEIGVVSEIIYKAIDSVRDIIYDLSTPTLYRFGLEAAVFEYATNLFKKHENIEFEFISGSQSIELQEEINVLLFQSVRELLFNVIKYAKAGHVKVEMQIKENYFEVAVSDDGVGFDVSSVGSLKRTGGFGLFHMRERFEHIGGKLLIDSEMSKGSRFCLTVPYSN